MDDTNHSSQIHWIAFALGFDNSATLVQHLRQVSPDTRHIGELLSQYYAGNAAPLRQALTGHKDVCKLRDSLCEQTRKRIDRALLWEQAATHHYLLGFDHPHYPSLLRNTDNAPPLLYAKGNLAALTMPALAIVGSRKASRQCIDLSYSLAASMAARGVCIVSGLARGIDAAAHEGALSASGVKTGSLLPNMPWVPKHCVGIFPDVIA